MLVGEIEAHLLRLEPRQRAIQSPRFASIAGDSHRGIHGRLGPGSLDDEASGFSLCFLLPPNVPQAKSALYQKSDFHAALEFPHAGHCLGWGVAQVLELTDHIEEAIFGGIRWRFAPRLRSPGPDGSRRAPLY